MQGLQNTSNETFREIVGNGVRLEVPRFQRDYSWEYYHWTDLWEDIESMIDEDGWHYLGFIVLQRRGENQFAIIDGQQRITTLSLLVLAAIKAIYDTEEPEAAERAGLLRAAYIGRQDPVTLLTTNKLSLNRNNEPFYKSYLSELRPPSAAGRKASDQAMYQAFQFFLKQLKDLGSGSAIAERVERVAGRMYFTVIKVTSELNAYKVFETLNARGVQLSAADLLKNYLFTTVDQAGSHEDDLEALEQKWIAILDGLGRESFQDFLRAFWNSKYGQVRAPQLYRKVKDQIKSSADVFQLLRDLEDAAPIYAALKDPGSLLWVDKPPSVKDALETLKLLGVRQHLPLLLAGYQVLSSAGFEKLIRDVVAFSFRYNLVGSRNSGDQETLYGEAALIIRRQKNYQSALLLKLYPNDQEFKSQFRSFALSGSSRAPRLAVYILSLLERQSASTQILSGSSKISIEHILPQSPSDAWYPIDHPVWERAVWRIGNLTLLEQSLNQKAGQLDIQSKLASYAESTFTLTRKIEQFIEPEGDWSENAIDRRQRELAELATVVWRLSGNTP